MGGLRKPLVLLGAFVFAALPACGSSGGEDFASEDAALEADWGESDEDAIALTDADLDQAAALSSIDEDAILAPEEPEIEVTMPSPTTAPALFQRPASCKLETSLDLIVYYETFGNQLYDALAKHTSGCSRYFIAIPKVAASPTQPDANLFPRKLKIENVHNYGKAFVATAEFHWGMTTDANGGKHPGWKNVEVIKLGPGQYETKEIERSRYFRVDWYKKGVLFRQRMAKAGYMTQFGDTWHINELESSWARSAAYTKAVRDLTSGLADGDPEYDAYKDTDPALAGLTNDQKDAINASARKSGVRGIMYLSAIGRRMPGETTDDGWKNAIKQTLRRKKFWGGMANNVEYWGQERYAGFGMTCNNNPSLDAQTAELQTFQEMLPEMARQVPRYKSGSRAGQSPVATALFYLSHRYTPVINGAWGWNNNDTPEDKFGDFVAGQIYATRDFANTHSFPDGRLGLYWKPRQRGNVLAPDDPGNVTYANRVAISLNGAYDGRDGNASGACGDGGCRCGN